MDGSSDAAGGIPLSAGLHSILLYDALRPIRGFLRL